MCESSYAVMMKSFVLIVWALIVVTECATPPPPLTCGPSEKPGSCIPECPCQGAANHCDVYDEQCEHLPNNECCCYDRDDEIPTLCTGEDPPGTSCGPNDSPGTCEVGCPCDSTAQHCPLFDDQCTVLDNPDACCCYDETDTVPDVCYE